MRPRIVLDTNITVSALLFGGLPRRLLQSALEGELTLATSSSLLAELEQVLRLKFPHAPQAIWDTVALLNDLAIHVVPAEAVSVIREDPADNRVLECAVTAHADAIVSGDRHLLVLKTFRGIPILSPRVCLDAFGLS